MYTWHKAGMPKQHAHGTWAHTGRFVSKKSAWKFPAFSFFTAAVGRTTNKMVLIFNKQMWQKSAN
jgi:hypothetical protein